jgi:hypothetical protein
MHDTNAGIIRMKSVSYREKISNEKVLKMMGKSRCFITTIVSFYVKERKFCRMC